MTGPTPSKPPPKPMPGVFGISLFWLGCALALTLALHIQLRDRPFEYPFGWVSAHFATMARSFVDNGVWKLGLTPVQNNAPLGNPPDHYLHWPPGFPILLYAVFRVFGESESSAHGAMLVILLANAAALYALVRQCCGRRAGLLAAFAFLVMPATIAFGHLVLHLHLAIFFMMLSLLAYLNSCEGGRIRRSWAMFGAAALTASVWCSWEPALLYPGLVGVALWQRRRMSVILAMVYSAVGVTSAAVVLLLFARTCPEKMNDLLQTVLFRVGASNYAAQTQDVHLLVNSQSYQLGAHSPLLIPIILVERLQWIGQLGVAALGWVLIRGWKVRRSSGGRTATLLAGLAIPWVVWSMAMSKHILFHPYEMMMAVPLASAALGWAGARLSDHVEEALSPGLRSAGRLGIFLAAPVILLLAAGWELSDRLAIMRPRQTEVVQNERMIAVARAVRESMEPGTVVMMPFESMVPVYYSQRHVIRAVSNDALVEQVSSSLPRLFGGSKYYLALDPRDTKAFPRSLQRLSMVRQTDNLLLLEVKPRTGEVKGTGPE